MIEWIKRYFFAIPIGYFTTLKNMLRKPVSFQYPKEKRDMFPRYRGLHFLERYDDDGSERCVCCGLCAAACPADAIYMEPEETEKGERKARIYEINEIRCIFCGYCESACPFDAITMGHDYEISDYNRSDLIFTKEMLLAEPLDRTPLRSEGE